MMDRIFGFDADADSALRNFKAVRHPDPELSPLGEQQVQTLENPATVSPPLGQG